MIALLYQETEVNPLAGCLPALLQIPVFISLYRSFTNLALAKDSALNEPFLWLPDLTGPVYGERSTNWLTQGWVDGVPSLGWDHTLAFLSLPIFLVVAQCFFPGFAITIRNFLLIANSNHPDRELPQVQFQW